jgi:general secretion pathway protein D
MIRRMGAGRGGAGGAPSDGSLRLAGRTVAVLLLSLALAACVTAGAKRTYKEGRKYAKAGDYDRAVLSYSKALNMEPTNLEYRMALSRARFRASQVHFDKGQKYMEAGRLELGVQEFQAAVFLDSSNDYAAVELQKAQLLLAERQSAEESIQELEDLKKEARKSLEPPKLNPASNVPIFLKFNDEQLGKIFDALSKASGINFLYDDRVELNKRVTVDQAGVTFEQALDLLMIQNKLFFKVHDPSTLIIIPDNRQKRQEYEDQVIKTFYLSNAEVKDVQTTLRTLLDARKVAVNDQLNSITIKDTPDVVAVAEKLVAGSDKAKAEVIVDVEIIEVNRNTFQNLGIDITTSALALSFQGGTDIGNNQQGLSLGNLNALNNRNAWAIGPVPTVILNFLKTDSDSRMIAKPQLRVTEGERAQLNIGERVPIPTTSFNTANTVGGNIVPLTSFTYQNVGISVEIEPRVHHNHEVTLNVAVEVSALAGSIAGTGGQQQPIIGTRNIATVIRLKEGESQILAGLIEENDRKSLRTIPGFDKIPILRKIFGTHETTKERQDVILTLTPRILRSPDIRSEDLQAMWVGTSSNVVFEGAERSPFGTATPFDSGEEGAEGEAGDLPISGLDAGEATDDGAGDAGDTGAAADEGQEDDRGGGGAEGDAAEGEGEEPPVAVVLNMLPSNSAPAVGEVVTIQVQIFQAQNVVSTPFKLKFDASHLEYVAGAQGPFLAAAGGNVSFLAGLDSQQPGVLSVGLAILAADAGGGVDGNGSLCTLSFRVLEGAATSGTTSIIPFNNKVFAPGLNEQPSIFRSLTLQVGGGS